MKKTTCIILCFVAVNLSLFAQTTIEKVLLEIEQNNTGLIALREKAKADKIGNKTELTLQNPEVAFNYLWGNPTEIGNRKDFSIQQSFDFPTAYKFKYQISEIKNEQVELEYDRKLKSLLLQARNICSDLVYTNVLIVELSKRLEHAKSIANAYKIKTEIGESSILDYNKAQLNLLNKNQELDLLNINKKALIQGLIFLNGGQNISFEDSLYVISEIPINFEEWYAIAELKNPILNWLKQEVEIGQKQLKLQKAMSLPKINAGYMSEEVAGEQFQGISLGLSIPLWENKNEIKYARAKSEAIEKVSADNKLQFYYQLKAIHSKVIDLQKNVTNYKTNIKLFNNTELLKKSLDNGEISLINYMLEISIYYESTSKIFELENKLSKAVAELKQY